MIYGFLCETRGAPGVTRFRAPERLRIDCNTPLRLIGLYEKSAA
jgi:hypothetical protein